MKSFTPTIYIWSCSKCAAPVAMATKSKRGAKFLCRSCLPKDGKKMTACQACGRRALIGRIDYGSEILCGQHFVKRHQGEDWILGVTVQKKEMFFLAVGKSDCEKAALILRGLQ